MNKLKKYIALFLLLPAISYAAADDNELWQAVAERNAEKLQSLVDGGTELNVRDENGDTLLYYAIKHKAPLKVLRVLISGGADVNAPSSESGMTPLVYVAMTAERVQNVVKQKLAQVSSTKRQETEAELKEKASKNMQYADKVIRFLVENDADVNQETPYGTALMQTVRSPWNKDITDFLLKSGADVNQCDRNGRSALFYAEAFSDSDTVIQLLSADADPDIKDKNGKTYLEVNKDYMLTQ